MSSMLQQNKILLKDGLERLHTKWPQAHIVESDTGFNLVVVPSVILPAGYKQTICTVLFVTPPGFPASRPQHFWTDIDIELAVPRAHDGLGHSECLPTTEPQKTNKFFKGAGHYHPFTGEWVNTESRFTFERQWPQWRTAMIWGLSVYMWNPNQSGLYTYMSCIRQRLVNTILYLKDTKS